MSVATDSMGMGAGRVVGKKMGAGHSLVISSNLDALLEHDERIRRNAHGLGSGSWSSAGAFPGSPVATGLPPPPRRSRGPLSPPPRSPLILQQSSPFSPQQERADTPESVDSNPYINPAPQFVEQGPTPISPPPRTSSMEGFPGATGRAREGSVGSVVNGVATGDTPQPSHDSKASPSSSETSSPADSRFSPRLFQSPSLPALLRRSSPKEPQRDRTRKLVKTRESPPQSHTKSQPSLSSSLPPEIMSDVPDIRRQHSRRRSSISVSSAISTDRESFIDLFSPTSTQDFDQAPSPFEAASPSPSEFPRSKPPIPTTPKPDFRRRPDIVRRPSPIGPPPTLPVRAIPPNIMPPTTNFLNPSERAQLIKKSRKLAQVFGQTPGAADFLPDARSSFLDVQAPSASKPRHRVAASMNMVGQMPPVQRPLPPWPAPEKTIHMNINGRRHSTPSTPISDEDQLVATELNSDASPSPRSFMEFSNSNEGQEPDLGPDESVSVTDTVSGPSARSGLPSPSPSLFENLSPEEQAEEERRKKRDKLAKLHRFLGSRVPPSLVLGPDYLEAPLPPPIVALDGTLAMASEPEAVRNRPWVKRRRSSSAAIRATWSDDLDRLKEDLNDREKAIIVRRAQKMEKVFGVAPPQKLYSAHHHGSSPTASGSRTAPASPGATPPPTPPMRNPNQTPYKRRSTPRKSSGRPSTADSDQLLLSNAEPSAGAGSFVYAHYQHSLNSLHDILDRNDKESLAELHQYLNDADADASPPRSPAPSKVERRRSLPARTSMASLASIASASSIASAASSALTTTATTAATTPPAAAPRTPEAERSEFQQRRRRAAKLTQFFGVDYRDLIDDVLESIEHGLDAERRHGTLNPAEAEDLLAKLRTLKTRRA
ncbi:hypothetical protein B0H17DRAFT_1070262 [Mycena rosella]|uniref:Uncharacterized protein n=1 Tax=Mycena rosella TaxID=1033263 RepID=A0AAD7DBP6_MYCRO|nr:hypothetical protein B0H17DRAFT_1070262 [Mycena rosella]